MPASLILPINQKDHIRGCLTSPVTLLEYGDYQCLVCKLTNPIIIQLLKVLDGKFRFVFRHFPLQQAHPYALAAAKVAEAAGQQNQFWEMHDLLFANQMQWTPEQAVSYAEQLKLDIPKFRADLESTQIAQNIENDFNSGVRSGVNGTPCFYINGQRYDGDASFDLLKQKLKEAAG